jgi:hypothetical protein
LSVDNHGGTNDDTNDKEEGAEEDGNGGHNVHEMFNPLSDGGLLGSGGGGEERNAAHGGLVASVENDAGKGALGNGGAEASPTA